MSVCLSVDPYVSVLLIFKCQQRLLDGPTDVGVGGRTLEVGGSKLRELVVREILIGHGMTHAWKGEGARDMSCDIHVTDIACGK